MESCGQFYVWASFPCWDIHITFSTPYKSRLSKLQSCHQNFSCYLGSLNTFRLLACFLHKIPTGLYFMTFAAGLGYQFLFLAYFIIVLFFLLFYVIINFYKNYFVIIYFFFFMKIIFIFSCSRMFRNVPACSGMFRVPGFIDGQFQLGLN